MFTQLTKGLRRRVMYVESKDGLIDGARARIGWVAFSRTGQTVYYRGLTLQKGSGVSGNFFDADTRAEYWISGVKRRGSNAHPAEAGVNVEIDPDAVAEYERIRDPRRQKKAPE